MRRSHLLPLFLLIGCADSPTQIASNLAGTWSQEESNAHLYMSITLAPKGSRLTGIGTFAWEAGLGGPMEVSGEVTGSQVALAFTMHSQFTDHTVTSVQHFVGDLRRDELWGVIQSGDPPSGRAVAVRFIRR